MTRTKDLVISRVFNATLDQVWNAWHDPADVMRWWGPTGFSCPLAQIDFREEGTSLLAMRPPKDFGDQDLYSTWTYQKIVPMERIEYVHNLADQDGHAIDPTTPHPSTCRRISHKTNIIPLPSRC